MELGIVEDKALIKDKVVIGIDKYGMPDVQLIED